ncbi:MAG TPA: hemolysin III family protein [Bacteroidales bacterium]|nr:hemolysin III family protein [Bacteroidales bacterium]
MDRSEETGKFTKGEELANAISHLTGALLGVAALVLMVVFSAKNGTAWHIVSTAVFGATLVILYLSSMFTHWLPQGRTKEFFFTMDQIAIFMLIAGTYTPIALITLHGPFGWVIFGTEWGLAVTGIVIKLLRPVKYAAGVSAFYIILYASMGWLVLIALVPLIRILPVMGWMWILIGGFFYSFGIYFFRVARFRYAHLVWHLLVLAGSISHFIAVFFYVIDIALPE